MSKPFKQRFSKKFCFIFISIFTSFFFLQANENEAIENSAKKNYAYTLEAQRELRIVQSSGHLNLNPQLSTYSSEAQILNGLFEGLFSYDPLSLEPIPALASSYKVSRDKKTWTFTIRKNAKFSNGETIDAKTIYDSWLSLIDPEKNAPFASLFDCIEGVRDYRMGQADQKELGIQVKNESTLVLKLLYPTEHLAKILCHHAFSVVHPNKSIGSGPFFLQQLSKFELVIAKNSFYWDKDAVALPSIRFIFSDDEDENTYLFNIGEVHWLSDNYNTLKLIENDSLVFGTQFGTEYYFFKINDSLWANPKAREALLLALDWKTLRENYYVPATTLLSRLYGYPQIYGLEENDLDEAKALLESLNLSDTEKIIKIAIPDTNYHQKQVEVFIESWEKLGIQINITKIPSYDYYNQVTETDADLFTYTWIGDFADPMAFLELFKENSSLNESNWSNKDYEKLLKEATTIDSKNRYEKLSEAEQILLDDYIIIPLSHPVSVNIIDKEELGGWFDNSLDLHPLKNLYFKPKEAIKNLLIAFNP